MLTSPSDHNSSRESAGPLLAPLTPRFSFSSELEPAHSVRCFLAQDRRLGTGAVVLRVLPKEKALEASELLAFLIESHAAAKLSHQNIAASAKPEQVDNFHYSVCQYPEGAKTLRIILDRNGWLDVSRAAGIALQLAQALQHAHGADVLHLSLQPDQVWVDSDDKVTLTGFGVPRTPERDWIQKRRSQDGIPAYRSPEQLAGEGVDERSDLYSLGVVLYEMLTDMLPYQAADARQLQQKIALQKALPIGLIRPEVPATLAAVISRLLARNPSDRFADATDLQAALKQILDDRFASPQRTAKAPVAVAGEEEDPLSFLLNDLDDEQRQSSQSVAAQNDAALDEASMEEEGRDRGALGAVTEVLTAEVVPNDQADFAWDTPRDEVRQDAGWQYPVASAPHALAAYAGESLVPIARPAPLVRKAILRYVLIAFLIGYSIGIVGLAYSGHLTSWFDSPASPEQISADEGGSPALPRQLLSTDEPAASADPASSSASADTAPTEESPAPPASESAAVIPSRNESPVTTLREQLRRQQRKQGAKANGRNGRKTATKAGRTKSQRQARRLKFWK